MVQLKTFAVIATTLFGCALTAPTTTPEGVDSAIPDSYIITLKPDIKQPIVKAHMKWVGDVHKRSLEKRSLEKRDGDNGVEKTFETEAGFRGYSGTFDPETIKEIKKSSAVRGTDQNFGGETEQPSEEEDDSSLEKRAEINQTPSTWGLGTISHRKNGFNNYYYHKSSGADSYAYVVDSGVRITHKEFQGRAKHGWTAFRKDHTDRLGHGTHVAGTIIGKTYGVAKKAKVVSVKVFQGDSADLSVILSGIEWAVNDIVKKKRQEFSVVNLSLAVDGVSGALNDLIKNAAKSGVIVIVAAGNQGKEAKLVSPASAPQAITVGAIDNNWKIPSWSNYGSLVDILAPGVGITSASWLSDNGTYIENGTSMACPHVAGLVLYAQSVDGVVGVSSTMKYLKKYATNKKVVGDRRGSPNRIANNNNFAQSK
ncbi:peptidase S8/S53 domain-containing protein [Fusarium flagelliforme]|uniref:peptidase S8/S53 domain-containing protein n=1 Tax=Fusarium flagelliforme TaxID=2675880 RepID=UPI001E8CFBB9|nr:peptidase S8/S53 domain-containing protein [Fusarium flagelliforme]KAH7185777.1 peptidase S8/S53 domain-containing protein [Fusarium flagelliforme]